jgi:phospholipid transport system transporter-binding protein
LSTPAASRFEIEGDGGRAHVHGALSFATVTALLADSSEAIAGGRAALIDLKGVTASDSAGLALLIEWLSIARAAGRDLRYESIPAQLLQLARLSDVEGLLTAA